MADIMHALFSNVFSWTVLLIFPQRFNRAILLLVMAWHHTGDKPLLEPKLIPFDVTRFQWVQWNTSHMVALRSINNCDHPTFLVVLKRLFSSTLTPPFRVSSNLLAFWYRRRLVFGELPVMFCMLLSGWRFVVPGQIYVALYSVYPQQAVNFEEIVPE